MKRFPARWVPALLLLIAVPTRSRAQATRPDAVYGSRYLSMENWAYDAITQLRRRGLLSSLDPLAQPYHRMDVARAVAALNPDTLQQPVSQWVRLLRDELAPEFARLAGRDSLIAGYEAIGGITSSTSRSLDPLLPWRHPDEGTHFTNRAWTNYGLGGWFELGRLSGETRLFEDWYLKHGGNGDPLGRDPGGIAFVNKTDNAYLEAAFSHGDVFIGRMKRNWGPLGTGGLMVSDNPTAYPQVGFDLKAGRVSYRFFLGELDTLAGTLAGTPRQEWNRFFVAHELEYRTPNFGISIGESDLYAASYPLINTFNPMELFFFQQDIVPQQATSNTELNGKLWIQRGPLLLYGETMLDDIHVDNTAPVRAAISGGAQYVAAPWMELGGDLRVVTSLTYWTTHSTDQWDFYYRGLGDPFSDYVRATMRASLYPHITGLRLTPMLVLQAKGEGDYRTTVIPTDSAFRHTKNLFLGVRENTTRLALAGRYQPTRSWFLDWDGGLNFVTNANHVVGNKISEFQGVVRFGVTLTGPRVGTP